MIAEGARNLGVLESEVGRKNYVLLGGVDQVPVQGIRAFRQAVFSITIVTWLWTLSWLLSIRYSTLSTLK